MSQIMSQAKYYVWIRLTNKLMQAIAGKNVCAGKMEENRSKTATNTAGIIFVRNINKT